MNIKSMLSQQLDRFGLLPTQQAAASPSSKIICKNFGEAGHTVCLIYPKLCPKELWII